MLGDAETFEITGLSLSLTVTANWQVCPLVVETLTVVVPTGKNVPDAGALVTVPQLPVVTGEKLTTAPHWPGVMLTVIGCGQVSVHAVCAKPWPHNTAKPIEKIAAFENRLSDFVSII